MRELTWKEYFEKFDSWAESTRESYVSRITDFSGARHRDVATVASYLFNPVYASRLVNKAMDAGIRFDSDDIYLMSHLLDPDTLRRAKKTKDDKASRREMKRQNKEDFWTGAGFTMIVDDFVDTLFGKK